MSFKSGVFCLKLPAEKAVEQIRDSVILPIMLTIAENNREKMKTSTHSLKQLYTAAVDVLMIRIQADLMLAKKSLRENEIKVWEEEVKGNSLNFRYRYQGYENQLFFIRDRLRAEISMRFGKYINDLFKPKVGGE